jgi:DNA-binding sugar fermentation-stimulating protein
MSKLDFMIECGDRLICVDTALENENILEALKAKDAQRVCEILDNEF